MKQWFLLMAMAGFVLTPGWAAAEEGHSHHEHAQGHEQMSEHGSQAVSQTITGEVVDLACYLTEGMRGPGHRECAQKCITSGLPVGIKTQDRLYLVIGSEHGPANKTLASLAAQQVTAEGKVSQRDGVHLIAIKKVGPSQ